MNQQNDVGMKLDLFFRIFFFLLFFNGIAYLFLLSLADLFLLRNCQFHLSYIYGHRVIHNNLLFFNFYMVSSDIHLFVNIHNCIFPSSFYCMVKPAGGLSISIINWLILKNLIFQWFVSIFVFNFIDFSSLFFPSFFLV